MKKKNDKKMCLDVEQIKFTTQYAIIILLL